MILFKRESIRKSDIPNDDLGIKVSDLLSILEKNLLTEELYKILDIDSIKDEFISIKGASTIVKKQKNVNTSYHKEDLKSDLKDITFYSNDTFTINFNNIQDNEYFDNLGLNRISVEPKYSSEKDFFSELYQMDKYAHRLIKGGYRDILEANLEMLKGVCKPAKKYRLVHDKSENLFYLRAIISLNKYHNYDNNIAIVTGFLTLHNEMKKTGIQYSINLCEYNESFFRIFLESSEVKKLESIGYVKNIVEISNDEIKREALKFSGSCSIIFNTNADVDNELLLSSKNIKSEILSVGHNQSPKNAFRLLSNIDKSSDVHAELFKNILKIKDISSPEQIKFLIVNKIDKVKNEQVRKIRNQILDELKHEVKNIIQLLTMFKKIELLAEEDIEATEYLRFIIYQALIERK